MLDTTAPSQHARRRSLYTAGLRPGRKTLGSKDAQSLAAEIARQGALRDEVRTARPAPPGIARTYRTRRRSTRAFEPGPVVKPSRHLAALFRNGRSMFSGWKGSTQSPS